MGIKHADVKTTGQKGYATEWNKNHIIDDDVDWNAKKITNLAEPAAASDAATKGYVDAAIISEIQFTKSETPPVLTEEGELHLWEGAPVVYDDYDSIIDPSKWTTSATKTPECDIAEVQETDVYIQCYAHRPDVNSDYSFDVSAETKELPELSEMDRIELRCYLRDDSGGLGVDDGEFLFIFGNKVRRVANSMNDSVYVCIKKVNDDWEIYDDGVFLMTITPSSNKVKVRTVKTAGYWAASGELEFHARLFEIKTGGGTALLARNSTRTMGVYLREFT